ncbi:MAG: sensor domain-containing diguanylate cyclase [Solirubrobacteraceae bacterium]
MGARLVDLPRRAIVVLFLLLSLGPLALLAYFSVTLATDAVNERIRDSLRIEASISARYIQQEMQGLAEVNESFAHRPVLVRAMSGGPGNYDTAQIRRNLRELSGVRSGIGTAFVARPDGRLIDIVPLTPAIIGKDFRFRDWYQGITRTGKTYVSEAYETQAENRAKVVAVASSVRSLPRPGRPTRELGILVVAYRLDTIQAFATRFAESQDLTLTVSDQAGVLLADDPPPQGLDVRGEDAQIAAALRGENGVAEVTRSGRRQLAGWAPVPKIGWAVVAATPAATAFREVGSLRRAVIIIAVLLGLILLAGVSMLNLTLRLRQVAESELRTASLTDALTGVLNRRAWDEALPLELSRSRRNGTPLTVGLLDIDHFKTFNDTHGHQAGDAVLHESAQAWLGLIRNTDVLTRYGGEEFAVALPNCPLEQSTDVVERMRKLMPDDRSCSVGVATWDGQESAENLVGRADAALYEAKRTGRDRVVMASSMVDTEPR